MRAIHLAVVVGAIGALPGAILVAAVVAGNSLEGGSSVFSEPDTTMALFKASICGFATVLAGALFGVGMYGLWRLSIWLAEPECKPE